MLSKYNNILIIRLSSLGDIILTTPVIRALKKTYAKTKFDFLVQNSYADVLRENPNIQNVIKYDRKIGATSVLKELEANKYDAVIDLQNNRRSNILTKFLGIPIFKYKKPTLSKFLLVNFKINKLNPITPIPVRYSQAVKGLNLDSEGPEIFCHNGIEANIEFSSSNIGICPGSKHFTKMWPIRYYIELCNSLIEKGYNVYLFGGLDDIFLCRKIKKECDGVTDLSNRNNLALTGANMKMCSVVVCNDSGLMHTATAVNVPVIAIFGSTVQEFGFAPYNSDNLILENKSLSCRPCSHIGKSKCRKKHFECMNNILPPQVLSEIEKRTIKQ